MGGNVASASKPTKMGQRTTFFQDLRRSSKHFVVDAHSPCGIVRSVQSLIFAHLGKDLGRAHGIAPLVEPKPEEDMYRGYI